MSQDFSALQEKDSRPRCNKYMLHRNEPSGATPAHGSPYSEMAWGQQKNKRRHERTLWGETLMGTRNRILCAWLKEIDDLPDRGAKRLSRHLPPRALAETPAPILTSATIGQFNNNFDLDAWTFGLAVALKF